MKKDKFNIIIFEITEKYTREETYTDIYLEDAIKRFSKKGYRQIDLLNMDEKDIFKKKVHVDAYLFGNSHHPDMIELVFVKTCKYLPKCRKGMSCRGCR